MKKHNKIIVWSAILIPVLTGAYLLYRYLKNPLGSGSKKRKKGDVIASTSSVTPEKAGSSSIFPLKNGSPQNGLVVQLQTLLGVDPDGKFGPKTYAALLAQTGKTQILSQSDFDATIALLQSKAAKIAAAGKASKIVQQMYGTNNKLLATSAITAYEVVKNAAGGYTATGATQSIPKNTTLASSVISTLDYTLEGTLIIGIKYLSGLFEVDPAKISVIV